MINDNPPKDEELTTAIAEALNGLITSFYGPDSYFVLIIGDPKKQVTRSVANLPRDEMYDVMKSIVELSKELKQTAPNEWKHNHHFDVKKNKKDVN